MKIFYSWQSDLPNSCNRGLIEAALQEAAKRIRQDDTVEVEPVIERDTKGVPGSPDIAATIFRKIDESAVFVCDISTVNRDYTGRKTPNPNVLIELGYAKKSLGVDRVLTVMNTHFGPISDLPFDLAGRRVIPYSNDPDIPDRASTKKELASKLEDAIRNVIDNLPPAVSIDESKVLLPYQAAVAAIEQAAPNRVAEVRRFMKGYLEAINANAPNLRIQPEEANSRLLTSIPLTIEMATAFATVVGAIALAGDLESCEEVCRGIEVLLEGYNLPKGFSGVSNSFWFDYYKFIGHEACTMLVAALLHEKKWDLLKHVVERPFIVPNPYDQRTKTRSFVMFSEGVYLPLVLGKAERKLSMHAEILRDRHSEGELSIRCPMDIFCAGDYFLALRSLVVEETLAPGIKIWTPWSVIYLDDTPRFIAEASRPAEAEKLATLLGVGGIATLRQRLKERTPLLLRLYGGLGYWDGPRVNLNGIGQG